MHRRITVAVDHIRGLYNVELGIRSFAGFNTTEDVTRWRNEFLSLGGVSEQKVERMDLGTALALEGEVVALVDEVFALAKAHKPLPEVEPFCVLPQLL